MKKIEQKVETLKTKILQGLVDKGILNELQSRFICNVSDFIQTTNYDVFKPHRDRRNSIEYLAAEVVVAQYLKSHNMTNTLKSAGYELKIDETQLDPNSEESSPIIDKLKVDHQGIWIHQIIRQWKDNCPNNINHNKEFDRKAIQQRLDEIENQNDQIEIEPEIENIEENSSQNANNEPIDALDSKLDNHNTDDNNQKSEISEIELTFSVDLTQESINEKEINLNEDEPSPTQEANSIAQQQNSNKESKDTAQQETEQEVPPKIVRKRKHSIRNSITGEYSYYSSTSEENSSSFDEVKNTSDQDNVWIKTQPSPHVDDDNNGFFTDEEEPPVFIPNRMPKKEENKQEQKEQVEQLSDKPIEKEQVEHISDNSIEDEQVEHLSDKPIEKEQVEHLSDKPIENEQAEHLSDKQIENEQVEHLSDKPIENEQVKPLSDKQIDSESNEKKSDIAEQEEIELKSDQQEISDDEIKNDHIEITEEVIEHKQNTSQIQFEIKKDLQMNSEESVNESKSDDSGDKEELNLSIKRQNSDVLSTLFPTVKSPKKSVSQFHDEDDEDDKHHKDEEEDDDEFYYDEENESNSPAKSEKTKHDKRNKIVSDESDSFAQPTKTVKANNSSFDFVDEEFETENANKSIILKPTNSPASTKAKVFDDTSDLFDDDFDDPDEKKSKKTIPTTASKTNANKIVSSGSDFDFDFDSGPTSPPVQKVVITKKIESENSIDFSSDSFKESTKATNAKITKTNNKSSSMDFDFDIDEEPPSPQKTKPEKKISAQKAKVGNSDDDFDDDFDL